LSSTDYVHGYTAREAVRLYDQASTLADLLHHDSIYAPGDLILEAGCGTGAQTVILAANNPQCRILSIDISEESLQQAQTRVEERGFSNVEFRQASLLDVSRHEDIFNHVFVCFVLEHLIEPQRALMELQKVLRKDGSLTAIEGDHGSWYCHPQSEAAQRAVNCLVEVQARIGGNALIGRQIFPLLSKAGLRNVRVSPRQVCVDASKPHLVEGFSKNTFIAMVRGVRESALELGLTDEETWERGIRDLYRATEQDGTFSYTFYKGVGLK
jgi:ubiquinone/menaquinone biosynthesis C-methylase UbiE